MDVFPLNDTASSG